MNLYHLSVGDETDKGILRNEIDALLKRILQLHKFLAGDGGIKLKEELKDQ